MRCFPHIVISSSLIAAPVSAQPFTQEAFERGVTYANTMTTGWGIGLAFADLDNDGDADLVVLGDHFDETETTGLYENDGTGRFANRAIGSGLGVIPEAVGVTAADYDADGDLDLYISCYHAPNRLFENQGDWTFIDRSVLSGTDDPGSAQGTAWADYDGDGDLDMYLANRTGSTIGPNLHSQEPNELFRNEGNGTFVRVGQARGVEARGDPSFQPSFFDYDRDGDMDIYLANDKGWSRNCEVFNRLYRNEGDYFTEVSAISGADGCIDAMCSTIGDVDGNGYQDIYCSNVQVGNYLYLNDGTGSFSDHAMQYGVVSYALGWGSCFFDYDNDGNLDLYVCNTFDGNRLYRNLGDGSCEDVAPALNVSDAGYAYCVAYADIDLDGDLDFAVSSQPLAPGFHEPVRLFINHHEANNWISLDLRTTTANTYAVGAEVSVRANEKRQVKQHLLGDGFKTQHELRLHFGLGQAESVEEVHVRFPNGDERTLRHYPVNERFTLYPNEHLGDFDLDGAYTIRDLLAFLDCFLSHNTVQPGCELADLVADGVFDIVDLLALLDRLL